MATPKSFKPKGASSAVPASFKPKAAAPYEPPKPDAADAAMYATLQGPSFGLGEEIAGGMAAVGEGAKRLGETLGLVDKPQYEVEIPGSRDQVRRTQMAGQAPTTRIVNSGREMMISDPRDARPSLGEVFTNTRDDIRKETKRAADEHPKLFNAVELGTSLPAAGGAALKGASKVAKILKPMAQGAINSFGHAEGSIGEQALETGMGALTSLGVDKGLRWAGGALKTSKLAGWLREKAGKANDEIVAAAQKSKDKAKTAATGAKGQPSATTARGVEYLEKHKDKLDPEARAKAEGLLTDPRTLDRIKAAADHYMEAIPQSLDDFERAAAQVAAAEARDPVAEAAGRGIKDVFLDDKSKKYWLNRAIQGGLPTVSGLLGMQLGGDDNMIGGGLIGTTIGTIGAAATGHGGTKIVNQMRAPETRKAIANFGAKALSGIGTGIEKLATPAMLETTDDPQKFSTWAEWIKSKINGK